MKSAISIHKLMIEGSKERKSLSGAIKCSKSTSTRFWNAINDKIKRDQVTPAWVIEHATDKQLSTFNRAGELTGKREIWSAWLVERIVATYYQSLS